MTKNVIVTFEGTQIEKGDSLPTPIEVITPGLYYCKNDKHYVIYDDLATDPTTPTRTTMKMSGDTVEIKRKGAVDTVLVFNEAAATSSYYTTSYTSFDIQIVTHRIDLVIMEDTISVKIQYVMKIQGIELECLFHMEATSASKANLHLND